ncbi:MAG: hypothetical protein IJB65_07515 [Clostridia bacterium]|nr:hypothetical protein [Clostridia bacterium]
MYLHEEGVKDQKRKERRSLIIMGVFSVLIGLSLWLSFKDRGFNTLLLAFHIWLFAFGIYISRFYKFFTPRRRYGTVRELKNYRPTFVRSHGGAVGAGATYSGGEFIEVTVVLDLDNGNTREFVFLHRGDLKTLKVGDRIGIFRFLRMPVWAE